jgi:hypothetical protein
MVWEANPYQLELVAHPLGVAVEELDRNPLRGSEDLTQRAGQF